MNRRQFFKMLGFGAIGAVLTKAAKSEPELGYYFARFEHFPQNNPYTVEELGQIGEKWLANVNLREREMEWKLP